MDPEAFVVASNKMMEYIADGLDCSKFWEE